MILPICYAKPDRQHRQQQLLREQRQELHRQTDHLFVPLMVLQWLGGILIALLISPRTWIGDTAHVHVHVWAAVFLGAVISSLPILMGIFYPGKAITRHVIAIGQASWSALLIHLSGGRIETHFHIFGSMAFLAIYRDWTVLATATLVVTTDHIVRGFLWPQSIYGIFVESPYLWIEHFGWIVFENIFLVISCVRGNRQLDETCRRQVDLEEANSRVEERVKQRTLQLEKARETLAAEFAHHRVTQHQRELLSSAIEGTTDFVGICDAQGQIQYINGAGRTLIGIPEDEDVTKLTIAHFHPPHTHLYIRETVLPIVFEQGTWDGEVEFAKRNGETVSLWMALVAHRRSDGTVDFVSGIFRDLTEAKRIQQERDKLQQEIADAARQAGMAEVATGVLHNVGNVLNSVNVSAKLLLENSQSSKIGSVRRAANLLKKHQDHLPEFLLSDQGQHFPRFLDELAKALDEECQEQRNELTGLLDKIDHIKEIVSTQQSFARIGGIAEPLAIVSLIEDALKIFTSSIIRHNICITRKFENSLPLVNAERNKILQILLNLIVNAKQAVIESNQRDREIKLSVTRVDAHLQIDICDNGIGIEANRLNKIFNHGYTTKKNGHGFGLHSSALSAQELGGSLTVQSDGLGQGATFTLRMPYERTSPCMV